MAKLSNKDIVKNDKKISGFPKVVVDQTNVRISDVIRRNLAGEQVLGTTKLAFDYLGTEEFKSFKVNPFNNPGFDLDDLIITAQEVGMTISDLQDRKGALDAEKAKLLSQIASQQKPKEIDPAAQAASQQAVQNINE